MRLKVGDRVVQVSLDYSVSKVGWSGIVQAVYLNALEAKVLFKEHPRPLIVSTLHLKAKGKSQYIAVQPKNKRGLPDEI